MRQTLLVFAALLSHWRRHPANFAALFAGLAIATALWSGVAALNGQARESYAKAAAIFTESGARGIVSAHGGLFSQEFYITLRRAGWKVSPVLEGAVRIGEKSFRLIGIEPLTAPRGTSLARAAGTDGLQGFLSQAGQTLVSPPTMRALSAREGETPATERGQSLPPLKMQEGAPGNVLIVDIGKAQALLDRPALLSRLVMGADAAAGAPPLEKIAGGRLRLVEPGETPDLARLTEAFHLNLTAFGFLAFLVGLFIVHAAHGLAFQQRLPMIRTLRALGAPSRALLQAMLAELVLLALIAGGAGMIGGYQIAGALLPNVAESLSGLYGAQIAPQLSFDPVWLASGLAMSLLGALIATGGGLLKTLRLPILHAANPYAWRAEQQRLFSRQALAAALAFAASSGAYLYGGSLASGFAVIAGLLLGAVLTLPLGLAAALRLGEAGARGPVAQWFWADNRRELPGLSLALMALLLALSANIGVGSMVEGFRVTFTGWLDERLTAEIYFEAVNDAEARRIEEFLRQRPDVAAILPIWKAQSRIGGWPAEVIGARPHETYRAHFPMLEAAADAWDRVDRGAAVMISEQLARRLNIGVGAALDVPASTGVWRAEVAGVYPDYGNPKGQLRIGLDALTQHWPEARRVNYSLRAAPDAAPALIRDLESAFGPSLVRIVDQAAVKALSMRIFERTFAVTAALNTLTLIVSAVALLAALTTLGNLRLAQLAPVWAVGVTRRRLSLLELARVVSLAAATALAAVPLGLALAWQLVSIINVRAFGWRLPFHFFPEQWVLVFALALAAALLSALGPALRLARAAPAELLKVFADER